MTQRALLEAQAAAGVDLNESRVASGAASHGPGVLLFDALDGRRPLVTKEGWVGDTCQSGADERRQPKQPKLLERPTADEDRRSGAARRIDGKIGHRNADEV